MLILLVGLVAGLGVWVHLRAGSGIEVESAELEKLAKTKKTVSGRDAEVLMNLVEALEDHDDVQKVFGDFELSRITSYNVCYTKLLRGEPVDAPNPAVFGPDLR